MWYEPTNVDEFHHYIYIKSIRRESTHIFIYKRYTYNLSNSWDEPIVHCSIKKLLQVDLCLIQISNLSYLVFPFVGSMWIAVSIQSTQHYPWA